MERDGVEEGRKKEREKGTYNGITRYKGGI